MLKAGTPQRVDNDPIGTGPFQLVQYQKDAKILYKAFDRYWEGKPKIDRLVFSITPDATVRYAKLQRTSAGDAVPQPGGSGAHAAGRQPSGDGKIRLEYRLPGVQYPEKPLDNVKVRRALALAVNKPAIIEAVFHGAGQPARTCCRRPSGAATRSLKTTRIRRSGRSSCCRKPGWGRGLTSICGRCRCSGPTTPTPSAWRR